MVNISIPVGKPIGKRLLRKILVAVKKDDNWKVINKDPGSNSNIVFIRYMSPIKGTSLLIKFYQGQGESSRKRKEPIPAITLIMPSLQFNKTLTKKVKKVIEYLEFENNVIANFRKIAHFKIPKLVTKEKEVLEGGKEGIEGYEEYKNAAERIEVYLESIYKKGKRGATSWNAENFNIGLDWALDTLYEFNDTVTERTKGSKGELRRLVKKLKLVQKKALGDKALKLKTRLGVELDRAPAMVDGIQEIIDFRNHFP